MKRNAATASMKSFPQAALCCCFALDATRSACSWLPLSIGLAGIGLLRRRFLASAGK